MTIDEAREIVLDHFTRVSGLRMDIDATRFEMQTVHFAIDVIPSQLPRLMQAWAMVIESKKAKVTA